MDGMTEQEREEWERLGKVTAGHLQRLDGVQLALRIRTRGDALKGLRPSGREGVSYVAAT